MKKYFVFSDVHSCYTAMMDALINKGFDENNPEHILISLGDNFDRGDESYEMMEFLKKYIELERIILVRGNHETLMLEMLERKYALSHDYHNRTLHTYWDLSHTDIFDYKNLNDTSVLEKFKYLDKHSTWYYELGQYIFVHGYIPCNSYYNKQTGYYEPFSFKTGYLTRKDWNDASWYNGYRAHQDGLRIPNKTIVCGHIGTYKMHESNRAIVDEREFDFSTFFSKDGLLICLDGTTAFSGIVNILVIDETDINFESKPHFKTNTKY